MRNDCHWAPNVSTDGNELQNLRAHVPRAVMIKLASRHMSNFV